jgi:xylan 1,4-beta-xylosidase
VNYLHEFIDYQEDSPIRLFLHRRNHMPLHWHKEMEILLILQGSIEVIVNNEHYTLKENDIMVINSDEIHSTLTEAIEPVIVLGIQINSKLYHNVYPDLENMIFSHDFCINTDFVYKKVSVLRYYLSRLMWAVLEKQKGYQLLVEGTAFLLLSCIVKDFDHYLIDETHLETSQSEIHRIRSILDNINQNYEEKVSLKELAAKENISSFYLSHLFKAKMGISFQEYLNRVRLAKATDLLIHSELKVVDILYSCGFSGPKFFYNFFKLKYDCTPTEYRKNHKPDLKMEKQSSSIQKDTKKPDQTIITDINLNPYQKISFKVQPHKL